MERRGFFGAIAALFAFLFVKKTESKPLRYGTTTDGYKWQEIRSYYGGIKAQWISECPQITIWGKDAS